MMPVDADDQFWEWVSTLPPTVQGHIRYGRDHVGQPIKILAYLCWQAGKAAARKQDQ